jgi:hypothetical protein
MATKVVTKGKAKISLNTDRLKAIEKQFKTKYVTQVGVLGGSSRKDGAKTNAMVGAYHEQLGGPGEGKLPQRSFLKMPLETKLPEEKAFIAKMMKKAVDDISLEQFFKQLGVLGENIVRKAFASSGFGKWPALKASTIAQKRRKNSRGGAAILQDSQQLRDSITSRVVKK